MITGIGCDIVDIRRIARLYKRYPRRFAKQLLSPQETEEFLRTKSPVRFLAKRFAAKEAVSKALGTGFKQGVRPHHISITHEDSGRPIVELQSTAKSLFSKIGKHIHISLSDEKRYAIAYVIITTT